ncbi:MAG: livM [Marmoricola sp.]|jgi:branched-chain amino acid transport system permease protein|nr:livM [Marmoricola sp.]
MRSVLHGHPRLVGLVISALVTWLLNEVLFPTPLNGYLVVLFAYVGGVVVARLSRGDHRYAALGPLVPLVFLAQNSIGVTELTQILILAIAALGLDLITGWTGQLNLAQGIFIGLGAYVTAILASKHGWPILLTLPLAGLVAAAAGLLLGVLALRFDGVYLAVLTSAVALAGPVLLLHYKSITNGVNGIIVNQPQPPGAFADWLDTDQWGYYVTVVMAIIAVCISWNLLSGRIGRALRALRDSPIAAKGIGVDLTRYKVLAFAVGSFWAGLAGGLYAMTIGFVSADSFGLFYSIQFLTIIVVGGLSTISGAFVGAVVIYELSTNVQTIGFATTVNGVALSIPQAAVYAILLILVVIFAPKGIIGIFSDKSDWSRLTQRLRGGHNRSTDVVQAQADRPPIVRLDAPEDPHPAITSY